MSLTPDPVLSCEIREAVNFGDRKGGSEPDILVLHYTGMKSADEALERLCGQEGQVSCHYLVHEDGRIVQMVSEDKRAWHAGKSYWRGRHDINSRSFGVEIVNPGHEWGYRAFPEQQVEAVIELCRDILARNAIPSRNVVAHSDIAPGRKEDPGELFPWDRLHEAGIGHWVEPAPISGGRFLQLGDGGEPVEALRKMFSEYGYRLSPEGEFDEAMQAVVTAFQRHFRQARIDGVADFSTITTLHSLLKALPVEAA